MVFDIVMQKNFRSLSTEYLKHRMSLCALLLNWKAVNCRLTKARLEKLNLSKRKWRDRLRRRLLVDALGFVSSPQAQFIDSLYDKSLRSACSLTSISVIFWKKVIRWRIAWSEILSLKITENKKEKRIYWAKIRGVNLRRNRLLFSS